MGRRLNIIFMGTPDFAVPALETLIEHHKVVGVVTQQDKRKGRGKELSFPPVKETAMAHGISVYQPQKVRDEEFAEVLRALQPDVIVVAAFGQILPESILNLPEYGCINIHASLLPKYRGAAPIQWSIINGECETGITTMYMAKGLDTGDMIDQVVVPIEAKETGESLHDKLAAAGAQLILETLEKLTEGTAVRIPQKDEDSCYAPMLTKELGEINWNKSAAEIERLVRGLNSWPSAYTFMKGRMLKIWDADVQSKQENVSVGTVTEVHKDSISVQTGDGQLVIREVQLQGKKKMSMQAFLLGNRFTAGMILGR